MFPDHNGTGQRRMIKKDRRMSAGFVALIVYLAIAFVAMLAFCRAAARGDRPMDKQRAA